MRKTIVALILVLLIAACGCPGDTINCCYEDALGYTICYCYMGDKCPPPPAQ